MEISQAIYSGQIIYSCSQGLLCNIVAKGCASLAQYMDNNSDDDGGGGFGGGDDCGGCGIGGGGDDYDDDGGGCEAR